MTVETEDKEMAVTLLTGLQQSLENLTVALNALGNEDHLFTLDFMQSRLLLEEQRCEMLEC